MLSSATINYVSNTWGVCLAGNAWDEYYEGGAHIKKEGFVVYRNFVYDNKRSVSVNNLLSFICDMGVYILWGLKTFCTHIVEEVLVVLPVSTWPLVLIELLREVLQGNPMS